MVISNYHDREIDDVSFKTVKRSIGETTETRSKGLQTLRKKLLGIEDLHTRLDDAFLIRYLRVAKFDANKAFERVRKYYSTKKKYAYIFDDFYPSACGSSLTAQHFRVSPRRAEDNSIVVIHKRGLFDPSTMTHEEMFRLDTVILEYLVDNPVTQLCGATILMDFDGYGVRTFLQDTPRRIKMAIDAFQNSFPLRFKSIHIVNAPQVFSLIYSLCYPFLTKKIKNRIHFHTDIDEWKSLHNFIPQEILPQAYGGTLQDSDMIDMAQEVLKIDDYFKEQLQYGFNKNKNG